MHAFLVTTSRGLDELLRDELSQLCPEIQFAIKGGQVVFEGDLQSALKVCLWSRLANRVLLKLADGEIRNATDLYDLAASVHWSQHFTADNTFVVDFLGTNKAINNSQFGALTVKDAIADHFSELFDARPSVDKQSAQLRVQARLHRNQVSLFLDLGGASLHQRHYRQDTGAAPLKEHLACAMLMRSGWYQTKDLPVFDPMCGSGTILIEAALIASNTAPGLHREHWGFTHWQKYEPQIWQTLIDEAAAAQTECRVDLIGCEINRRVLNAAKANADAAGVMGAIRFHNGDATRFTSTETAHPGFIVCNPPYGERLNELTELLPLFQAWGKHLKQHFQGWQMSLLTANRDLLKQLKLVSGKSYKMMNGPIACQLVNYALDEKNCEIKPDGGHSGDFANRLVKNIKRLNKWLKTQNTNCYRLYDADLPEYNVAIDRYADWVVVQEYAAPKDVPEEKARRRLHEVLLALPSVTGVAPKQIVLKTREQQKGRQQYQKVGDKQQRMSVHENGATLLVNLHDYLDTGLFLDHRTTRQMVRQDAKGKNVLNLFAYTGSVSVHAALGGAKSVTTVDMSRTYLDWAKDNFKANNLSGAYEFVQADCLAWLSQHSGQYDLIFVDPPSFSNSKRMDASWDVQRDHIRLLSDASRCLTSGGVVYFSNNLRTFKLDEAGVGALGLSIEAISAQTLPEDFKRNPKIHHCWKLTKA